MRTQSSDSALIIKQFFDAYFHQLVLSSFRYVQDYEQAEDIVQDVFVKLWQNINHLKDEENLKSYLFKAVKNSSLNFLRHKKVKQKFAADTEIISSSVEDIPEEESFSDEEKSHKIHQAVSKLPDHWREVFVLSKYDKLKYHEIAEKLKISPKTVEKYISKSLLILREELKDLILIGLIFKIFK